MEGDKWVASELGTLIAQVGSPVRLSETAQGGLDVSRISTSCTLLAYLGGCGDIKDTQLDINPSSCSQ